MFKAIDENNDGGVSFDEWLAFALSHYKTAAEALPKVRLPDLLVSYWQIS